MVLCSFAGIIHGDFARRHPSLHQLELSSNMLISPIPKLMQGPNAKTPGRLLCLGRLDCGKTGYCCECSVDISKNSFNDSLASIVKASLDPEQAVSATLSNNAIYYNPAEVLLFYQSAPRLRQLLCSHCAFTGAYFGKAVFREHPAQKLVLNFLDFSHNNFTGGTLFAPQSVRLVDLSSNTEMKADGSTLVATGLTQSEAWLTKTGVDIKCPKMALRMLPSQVFRLDPEAYSYKDCDCSAGWGTLPDCKVEPIKSVKTSGCLPEEGTKLSGLRQGQSIQWLIRWASV